MYYGNISSDALAVLQKAGIDHKIKARTGLSVIPVESPVVVLVALLIDDSKSINFHNNTQAIINGHNKAIEALRGSLQKYEILFRTQYMNGSVLNDWVPLMDRQHLQEMSTKNYDPEHFGETPLFDASVVLLGSVIAEVQKANQLGKKARSAVLIASDGHDETYTTPEECNASDVSVLVTDVLKHNTPDFKQHTISFMGIQDGETDYTAVAHAMGIGLDDPKWIITPERDEWQIRRAFETFSRDTSSQIKEKIKAGSGQITQRKKQWKTTKPETSETPSGDK